MPKRQTMDDASEWFAGEPAECWHLPAGVGGPNGNGYDRVTVSGERWFAHRLAYTLLVGPIPVDTEIDHLCHTRDLSCPGGDDCPHRSCCNPAHLEPVPHRINALRGRSAPADNARREVCSKGHPLVQKGSDPSRRHCPACRLAGRVVRGETSGNGHLRERRKCPQGHDYDEANTYIALHPDGTPKCRMCRACQREKAAARRAARKAAA